MDDSFFKKENDKSGESDIPNLDELNTGSEQNSFERDRGVIGAVLSYIPFLCLVPLLQMRDNETARFHSKQGLILFLIELLALLFLIPGLSKMIWTTVIVIALGASVAGIVLGIQGKKYRLPLIGDIADKMRL